MRIVPILAVSALIIAAILGYALVNGGLWVTGRPNLPPLTLAPSGPSVPAPGRIWIDTDAACGATARTDPDDCFAIVWLILQGANVVGISTSFGNATGDVVADTVTKIADALVRQGLSSPPVFVGHAQPAKKNTPIPPAVRALQAALDKGPLTILALGPLTNIASALQGRPDLQANVARLVAVMGHRPGHLFHPTEGNGHGAFWGHGPIFRDLNVSVDVAAVQTILDLSVSMSLIPYDAAAHTLITKTDLDLLATQGPAMAFVSKTARGWLQFWNDDVGQPGFYPFDWVAAAYLVDPASFDCALVQARVLREWAFWMLPRKGLLVDAHSDRGPPSSVTYCPQTAPSLHDQLISQPDPSLKAD